MAVEKFLQRLRSGDAPKDSSRITSTGGPISARMEPFVGVETIGRQVLIERVTAEYKAAKVRTLPAYSGLPIARKVSLWLGRRGPAKCAPHPMAGLKRRRPRA